MIFALGSAWSDAELLELLEFVRAGGIAVVFDENFASLDENHQEAERDDLRAWLDSGRAELGDGTLLLLDEDPGYQYYRNHNPSLMAWVDDLLSNGLVSAQAPSGVLVTPYRSADGLVIHILNYGYDDGFFDLSDLRITIESLPWLPNGTYGLVLRNPDTYADLIVDAEIKDGLLSFTVPFLHIWTVAELVLPAT